MMFSFIARCEQSKSMSVQIYFTQLSVLWEELHHHEPLIDCSCCFACTAKKKHAKRRDTNQLHDYFLMGLDSDYYA